MNNGTSRILAIDPGEQTGISYVQDGHFVWGMVCHSQVFDSEDFIFSLTKITDPTTIVIESPPTSVTHYNKTQYEIYNVLCHKYRIAGFKVVSLNPGLWKKLIVRTKIDATHIRDAADMARFQHAKGIKK